MDEVFVRFPELVTERLRLRELRLDDAEAVLSIFGDPEVVRYYDLPLFEDRVAAEKLVRQRISDFEAGRGIRWAITVPTESDRVLGSAGFWRIDRRHRWAELGYDLHRSRWGQGLAGEAVGRIVQFGFEALGLNRVEAWVDPRNDASIGLLEKLGFQLEGRLRRRYRYEVDGFQDDLVFARLAADA